MIIFIFHTFFGYSVSRAKALVYFQRIWNNSRNFGQLQLQHKPCYDHKHRHFIILSNYRILNIWCWWQKKIGNLTAFWWHSKEFVKDFWHNANTNEFLRTGENIPHFHHILKSIAYAYADDVFCICLFHTCVLVLGFVHGGIRREFVVSVELQFRRFLFYFSLINGQVHLFTHQMILFHSMTLPHIEWHQSRTKKNFNSPIRVRTLNFRTIYTHFRQNAS